MNGDFVSFFETQKNKRKGPNRINWEIAIAYFKQFAGEKVLLAV